MTFGRYFIREGVLEIYAEIDDGGQERCIYETNGYAGRGLCKNNPSCCSLANRGPLPIGFYRVGRARSDPRLGPVAIPLEPFSTNEMHQRTGFWIHGDSRQHPGNASSGCIILNRPAREAVAETYGLRRLEVVASLVPRPEGEDLNTTQ